MVGFGLSFYVEHFEESFLVNFFENFHWSTNQRDDLSPIRTMKKSFPDSGIGYSWLKNNFFDGPWIFDKILILVFQFSFFIEMTPWI